jgi:hypothetical protein
MRVSHIILAALFALIWGLEAASVSEEEAERAAPTTVRSYQEIPWTTGGVGADERAKLERMKGDFNLKIVLAAKGGPFLGDAIIEIRDENGRKVFEGRSDGPWVFLKLAPGTYLVRAANQGESSEQKARVGDSGLTEVHFYWKRAA